MIEPKEIQIKGKTYIISKFPCIEGRKIISGYPLSALPKLGDYDRNEEIMQLLMSFVAVRIEDRDVRLSTPALLRNHVYDWEILIELEKQMLIYNCSFLQNGQVSTFLTDLSQKFQALITKILTDSLAPSLPKTKQRSTN